MQAGRRRAPLSGDYSERGVLQLALNRATPHGQPSASVRQRRGAGRRGRNLLGQTAETVVSLGLKKNLAGGPGREYFRATPALS